MKDSQRKAIHAKRGNIKIGENPENDPKLNKFIHKDGDGHRGKIILLHKNKSEAIIKGLTGSTAGRMYHVKETNPKQYPEVTKQIRVLPTHKDWEKQ